MNTMSAIDGIRSWLWVIPYWALAYGIVLVAAIGTSVLVSPGLYWIVYLVGVPLLTIPIVYRQLVGGGCSLRFQVCAFVKGAFLGLLFFVTSMLVDPFVWSIIQTTIGWNALALEGFTAAIYQVWFYSGFAGGLGARIIEVRGIKHTSNITVAGFEPASTEP